MNKPRTLRIKAFILLAVLVFEICSPLGSYALTGGPSQPEVQSFEPVGTSQMVDAFTGDFNYNIPLLDVNGYPINIAYHAGSSMDEEASWVGVGWNINPGTVNRALRGLPDDMNGEEVIKEVHMKPNVSIGLNAGLTTEIFSRYANTELLIKGTEERDWRDLGDLSMNLGIIYNNYKGLGYSFSADFETDFENKLGINGGLSMGYSDDGGLMLEPRLSIDAEINITDRIKTESFNIGFGFSSRSGIQSLNLGVQKKELTYARGFASYKAQWEYAGSKSGAINYRLGNVTYTPGITTPVTSISGKFLYSYGKEVFGVDKRFSGEGFLSVQSISEKNQTISKKGYGYLYEQNADQSSQIQNRDYLLDFNRGNDGSLTRVTPYLPWVNHTFDIYGVSAQGVSGMFRLHRNDIPILHDDYRNINSHDGRAGLEFSAIKDFKAGVNLGYVYNSTESGAWVEYNNLIDRLGFVSSSGMNASVNQPQYESVYFRDVNELIPQNQQYLNLVDNDLLVSPSREGATLARFITRNYDNQRLQFDEDRNENVATQRTIRNKNFEYLLNKEYQFCLDKTINSYPMNTVTFVNGSLQAQNTYSRTSRNTDHITEVRITNSDGSRHVFGIPAYNNSQVAKSFRVDVASPTDKASGVVGYDANQDNTKANDEGIDQFYTSTKTPAYAHSYLITAVLSPDYVDLTGNGVSDDDLGSAVKFNYTKVHSNYRWRAPYRQDKARYSNGLLTDEYDDMGNYIYGEKEVWYLHSIEGKTHIALFILEPRKDGLGVKGENGGKDENQKLYRLARIELYSKTELKAYGDDAVPVKTVHFVYDYSICPDVENQVNEGDGKLTLKKIYFTYGKSNKGRLNPYLFHYNNDTTIHYHLAAYDRWGTYSPVASAPNNAEYPYTEQDNRTLADQYASLWNLNKIELPSGGVLEINYEADDYAYVQDKRAMRMHKIVNFGRESTENPGTFIRSNALYGNKQYDILFFQLEESLPENATGVDVLRKEYLKDLEDIQVTVFTKIKRDNNQDFSEYIKTYIQPKKESGEVVCGVTDNGLTGWFRFEKVNIRDENRGEEVNPIAKAGWQFARLNLMFLIDKGSNRKRSPEMSWGPITSIAGFLQDIANLAAGPNRVLLERNFCRDIVPNQSWVRLNDPNKVKVGGGHRVKSIVLNDSWDEMNHQDANAEESTYGQLYEYTTNETSWSGNYTTISSGVASYEPQLGSDENPFVRPDCYDQKRRGVPDVWYTFEHPVCENFFPSATVGYSKITVRSIEHEGQASHHRTGYKVQEFYTSKDFPTEVHATDIDPVFIEQPLTSSLLPYGRTYNSATATQGYIVTLNDMHGKLKANWSYDENDNLISGVEYKYNQNSDGTLNNEVLAIDPNELISTKVFGVNVDFAIDTRYSKDQNFNSKTDLGLDLFTAGAIPLFFASLINSGVKFNENHTQTASSIKIVRKLGLLTETIAHKEGSQISTQNLLYDGQTGEVLLTGIENEFGDTVYHFTYPAHWAYDEGMGQAYKNWGMEIAGLKIVNGELLSTTGKYLKNYLVPGDECILNAPGRYVDLPVWVYISTYDSLVLIKEDGELIHSMQEGPLKNKLQVIRSGRRNMARMGVGTVTTLKNPLVNSGGSYSLVFDDVLATSAVEYTDEWRTDFSLFQLIECDSVGTDFLGYTLDLIDEMIADTLFYNNYYYSEAPQCYNNSGYQQIFNYADYELYTEIYNDLSSDLVEFFEVPGAISNWYELDLDTINERFATESEAQIYCSSNHNIYTLVEQPSDSWDCVHYDTIGLTYNCQYNLSDDLYRDSSGIKVSVISLSNTTFQFQFLPGDSLFLFDQGTSQYKGKEGRDLILNGKNITRIDNWDSTSRRFWPSGSLITNLYNTGIGDSDTCDLTVPDQIRFTRIQDDSNNYKIRINGQPPCENLCEINLSYDPATIIDFLEVLDHRPINGKTSELTVKVLNLFNEVDTISVELSTTCADLYECQQYCRVAEKQRLINPYRTGNRGNWRPQKSWAYVDDREYAGQAKPQTDGTFTGTYSTFWQLSGDEHTATPNSKWVWTSEVTEYSPFGMELENKDPLGRYSSALYGYSQTLPIAVGSNTRHRQLWFEGFEEYPYMMNILDEYLCPQMHYPYGESISLMEEQNTWIDETVKHTGRFSLKLSNSDSLVQEIALDPDFILLDPNSSFDKKFITQQDDQIIPFRPTSGKYVVSAWVREADSLLYDTTFNNTYIVVEFEDSIGNVTRTELKASGLIIEQWQRIEVVIDIPEDAKIMRIKYVTQESEAWFDDLRIFPYNGNMKSYVYDHRTLRLIAELDENNYATFYEYDKEGNLVRVKKETEEGVKTLQENRQHQTVN